jgi:predicted KAP-like P-loop ATPase/HEAT repeat protein
MFSDRDTTTDALGFKPYVQSLYKAIRSPGITPFTVGIYGKWGTGKTSLMKMLQEKLVREKNIKTIWFNAWKFEKEKDMWVALIHTLLNEIEVKDESKLEEAKKIIKKLKNGINWMEMAKFFASIAVHSPDFGRLSMALDSNLKNRLQSLYDFEEEFEKLVELSEVDLLVVFIDDLDRCKKGATLNILEAIKLFLYSRKCVYILGLDHEKVCEAIASKFSKDVAEEYLDKIVQLPFFIPRVKFENMQKYLRFLVVTRKMRKKEDIENVARRIYFSSIKKFDLEMEENNKFGMNNNQLEEYRNIVGQQDIIIRENDHNPRKIKKFLNTYFLRTYIAENLDYELKNEYIVKFLFLELNHKNFHKDLERYSNLLKEIQSIPQKEDERKKVLEESDLLRRHFENKKLMSFLRRMEFGDVDPKLYLLLAETGGFPFSKRDELDLIGDLSSKDPIKISNAREIFSELGKEEKEHIIELILDHEAYLDIIEKMGSPVAELLIGILIKTKDDPLQKRVAPALGKISSDVVGPLIDSLAKTEDEHVQKRIVSALREIGAPAAKSLVDFLEETDDEYLKDHISEALAKIGNNAVDPLIGLLERTDNEYLISIITWTLAKIGNNAVDPLVSLLIRTDDEYLISIVSEALAKIGNNAVDPLIGLLERTYDEYLRECISEALAKIGNPKAANTLKYILKKTGDDFTKEVIEKSLATIQNVASTADLIG